MGSEMCIRDSITTQVFGMSRALLLTANFSEDLKMKYVYIAKAVSQGFGGA